MAYIKKAIVKLKKTSKKSANAGFFSYANVNLQLHTKKLCAIFDKHHRSGNDVGGSFKVSLWHTPTPA